MNTVIVIKNGNNRDDIHDAQALVTYLVNKLGYIKAKAKLHSQYAIDLVIETKENFEKEIKMKKKEVKVSTPEEILAYAQKAVKIFNNTSSSKKSKKED